MSWIAGAKIAGDIAGSLVNAFRKPDNDYQNYLSNQALQDNIYNNKQNQRRADHALYNGVKLRVQDAKRAGLHPLAALGVSPSSGQAAVVGSNIQPAQEYSRDMGQDISRAISAAASAFDREAIKQRKLQTRLLELEVKRNENSLVDQQTGPALPSADPQNDTNAVVVEPVRNSASAKGSPHTEAGVINDIGYVKTPSGGYRVVPSTDVKPKMEEVLAPNIQWQFNNSIGPYFGDKSTKPHWSPGPGKIWKFNRRYGEWRAIYPRSYRRKGSSMKQFKSRFKQRRGL